MVIVLRETFSVGTDRFVFFKWALHQDNGLLTKKNIYNKQRNVVPCCGGQCNAV